MAWRDKAMCRGEDPDLFFPVGNNNNVPLLLQTEDDGVPRQSGHTDANGIANTFRASSRARETKI
ncbi:WhiB family transcriptional regulator [Streptomyces clavifer]|uniref:hypothetical protein n=1 Tax=Streptomyces clavifer TaxID=68188 RepID=UPI00380303B2